MSMRIKGLHHVTAVSGPAQRNVDFYVGVLGLRLVKRTVNFDDPGTLHLYYGNRAAEPGSLMTFFPWAGAVQGRAGSGMTAETAFSVGSLDEWVKRFADRATDDGAARIDADAEHVRFGERVITLRDPDGLNLALVERAGKASPRGITGFDGVTLAPHAVEPTARLLTELFGYEAAGEENGRLRLVSGDDRAERIDLVRTDRRARPGTGTVHHVAFRCADDTEQARWADAASAYGLRVTPVQERNYFRSIYFREPGGILFEIATDPPGMATDEPMDRLGEKLMLPDWLEARRTAIESRLPPLSIPLEHG